MERQISITYDEFEKYIGRVKKVADFERSLSDLIRKWNKELHTDIEFMFPSLDDDVIGLLEKIMGCDSDVIPYFVWELEFGERWEPGDYVDDGVDIKLQTTKDLWDYLVRENGG